MVYGLVLLTGKYMHTEIHFYSIFSLSDKTQRFSSYGKYTVFLYGMFGSGSRALALMTRPLIGSHENE